MLPPPATLNSCTYGMSLINRSKYFFHGGCLMQDASNGEDWKRIAEQIAKEADPEKLASLVKELCDAFDLARKQTRPGSLDQRKSA